MVLVMLVGGLLAEDGHSEAAREFFERLGKHNREDDYRALEEWVFEAGLADGERRGRVDEGVWVLTGYDSRSAFDNEGREVWVERFLERLEQEAGGCWWAWFEAGEMLTAVRGDGEMVDGKFVRGRDGAANSRERDAARARQAFLKAMEMAREAGDRAEAGLRLADRLNGRVVTRLTDFGVLPAVSEERTSWRWGEDAHLVDRRAAVIGEDGEWRLPVLREKFEDATSDCERVYWLLSDAARISPKHAARAKLALAEMWHDLLGVDQLVQAGYVYLEGTESATDPAAKGDFELHTLRDDETILVGKNGPERRVLPEEARYLGMLRELVADAGTEEYVWFQAVDDLLSWLADRFHYDAAEAVAKEALKRDPESDAVEWFLKQIGPDGRFIESDPFVAGREVAVEFVSRELSEQRFELWEMEVEKYVAENGRQTLNGWNSRPSEASVEDFERYRPFFTRVATWQAPLEKKGNHMQSRNRVKVPVERAGAYLVVANVEGSWKILPVKVAGTILLTADLESPRSGAGADSFRDDANRADLFLIDAVSGGPVEGATVVEVGTGREVVSDHTGYLLGMGGQDGVLVKRGGMPAELLEVRCDYVETMDAEYIRSFLVTNQPLYRPGQRVDYAGWLRRPNWRKETAGDIEDGVEVRVRVTDPVGLVIHEKKMPLDEFDGFAGSFDLAAEMVLGDCEVELSVGIAEPDDPFDEKSMSVDDWDEVGRGSWTIKVAEFRKPDFRVEVEAGPAGGEFSAKVRATYHSGEPVKGAQVKAKLRAYPFKSRTFPEQRWDRLYDAGYDWPLPPAEEVEGWEKWGVRSAYDEMLSDQEYGEEVDVEAAEVTDGEGRASLVFRKDLPLLGNCDYDCTVRVGVQEFTGRSVGAESGFVFSGRDYEVLAQPEKGFYREGERAKVKVWTLTADRKAVAGRGVLTVDAVAENGGLQEVAKMDFATDGSGVTELGFLPPGAGRYRCVAEAGGGKRGFVLEVVGDKSGGYRGVKLVPSKVVGEVGERIEVLVGTEQEAAVVWLFEQMPDGLRRTPRMVTTRHHTAVIGIPLTKAGAPDFFLQAATLVHGRVEKGSCRIVLPPEDTRLEVAMAARPEKGEPGGRAEVDIAVKDRWGKPARASLAVTAFDRALEDLGGRWPDAGSVMRDAFEGGVAARSSQDRDRWADDSAFEELEQPGCFFERWGLSGKPPWRATGQFVVPGSALWVGYEPPELPNSVGSSDPFGGFPTTPATPSAYARDAGREVALSAEEKAGMAAVGVRKNFADRAYWGAALKTDAEGKVRAEFDFPANPTAWQVRAWAFGRGRAYGDGETAIEVSKPLQLRPLLPQAAVVGDVLEVGVMVQNLSEKEHEFQVVMEVDGVEASGRLVKLAAGGEGKLVWPQKVERAGTMVFRFRAKSGDGALSDGVESSLPVAARTTAVTVSNSAEIRGRERAARIELKPDEPVAKGTLRVRVEAHPAVSALAVLPDLVGYPYGCTEQTLNRFLPTLIAWKAAADLGIDWKAVTRVSMEAGTSLGWVKGRAAAAERPAELSDEKVRSMIQVGLARLKEMQGSNGSWGWFSADDSERSAYMTALAVRGIAKARELGFSLERDPAARGVDWLKQWARARAAELGKDPVKAGALDAWVVFVLQDAGGDGAPELKAVLAKGVDKLPASGLLHLALSMDAKTEMGEMTRLRSLAEVEMKKEHGRGWEWWRDPTELRVWHLKLLVKMGAVKEELESAIRELLKLRKDGVRWSSTKNSALCVEAIIEAARAGGGFEFAGGEVIEVAVEAVGRREVARLDRKNLWTAQVGFPIEAGADEAFPVVVRAGGEKPVMAMASLGYESGLAGRMEPVSAGIQVERRYFRVADDGKRTILAEGAKLQVGEVLEVELKVTSDDELSYVHLRDPIPAGLEPLMQLSGYEGGAYRESRSGETDFFISTLSHWNRVQSYHLRAVTRGAGTALPARAECMYAPEVSGQSGRRVIEVE